MDTTPGTWTLTGITASRAQCDHCGRDLARCFRVRHPDGSQMIVGRSCAKRLTGWSWTIAQAVRMEKLNAREAALRARIGDELFTAALAQEIHGSQQARYATAVGCLLWDLRDLPEAWETQAAVTELRARMAESVARYGAAL